LLKKHAYPIIWGWQDKHFLTEGEVKCCSNVIISGLSKAIISGLGKNQLRFFVADYRREDLDGQGNYRDEQKRD
jgi:hypothetical protein